MIPHSSLSKRWNALSYHKVREAIAGGWLRFEHIPGTENPVDLLTKALQWFKLKVYVEPLLMWKGDTAVAPSGSSNPEGSDTNPGHEQTRDSAGDGQNGTVRDGNPLRDANANPPVGNGQSGINIPIVLRGNQYAVLYDKE
jgi:hypothetical protein